MRHSAILILKKESFQLLIVLLRSCPLSVSSMLALGIELVFLKKEAIKKDVMFSPTFLSQSWDKAKSLSSTYSGFPLCHATIFSGRKGPETMGPHAQDEPTRDNVVAVVSVRSNALQLTKSKITYINKVLNAFIQEKWKAFGIYESTST